MKQSRTLFNSAGCLLALTSLLFNSSCSQEEIAMPTEDGYARFSITLPGEIGTRATFGDGAKASVNTLYWTLFEEINSEMGGGTTIHKKVAASVKEEAFGAGDNSAETVSMQLVVGKRYRIVFCAMNSGNKLVSYEDGILTMHYENASCNSVNDDVFTAVSEVIDITKGTGYSNNIELTRPLAQINWGSTDFDEDAVKVHLNDTEATVTYNSGLYTGLDLINNKAEGQIDNPVSFPAIPCNALPEQEFPLTDSGAKLVAMNYALTGTTESTISCKIAFKGGFETQVDVNNASVKSNFRTNIYGGLLTNPREVYVEMNKAFETFNSERYLTPETQKIVKALSEGQAEIVIPAEETIDLTGLGTFQLTDGQHITLNGTLILDSQQLVLSKDGDQTPHVDFDGNGIIYTTGANSVSINSGAKATFEGISIICEKQTTGGSALRAEGGEIELNAVTVKSTVNGISILENGKLKADGCNILAGTTGTTAAIYLSGAEESSIKNCSLIATVGYAILVKDSKVTVTGCKLDSYGLGSIYLIHSDEAAFDSCEATSTSNSALKAKESTVEATECKLNSYGTYPTIYLTDGNIAGFHNCEATSKYSQVLHTKNSNALYTNVNINGGSYHSESDKAGIHTMVFNGKQVESTLEECEVVSRGGSAVMIDTEASVSIKNGTYVSLNHCSAVSLKGNNPGLEITDGEFVTDNKSAIERVNDCTDLTFIAKGGKYSADYVDSDRICQYPIDTDKYEIREIDEEAPYGLRFKYEIVKK